MIRYTNKTHSLEPQKGPKFNGVARDFCYADFETAKRIHNGGGPRDDWGPLQSMPYNLTAVGQSAIRYICGQLEWCTTTGRLHYQFYVEFNEPHRGSMCLQREVHVH